MLEIKNLSVSYGENKIINDLSLSVLDGEITCVLGLSGVGKTTLLKAIANLIDYSGEIKSNKVSYAFQTPRLIDGITVFQNLKISCDDDDKINKGLNDFGIFDKAFCYPKTLSGGEAQRVNLLRAFLFDGDVMLLDEPFSSLDIKTKITLLNYFVSAWKKDKKATLFVTHDIDEALALASRVIVLKEGRIALDVKLDGDYPREFFADCEMRRLLLSAI